MRCARDDNERNRVSATRAAVHAATPTTTAALVDRGVSPFNSRIEVSRVQSAPATMSAMTYCTSFASRARDDYLRLSTTAYSRLVTREPDAAAAYVTWHGHYGQILGAT